MLTYDYTFVLAHVTSFALMVASPNVLQPPISKLVSLVQRDFVDYWYNTSIALSPDTPFPKQTTSLLNTIMNNAVARVKRQDPKEVSIYLFHSASTALISELRESKTSSVRDPALEMKEKDALIKKVRRTSEEVRRSSQPWVGSMPITPVANGLTDNLMPCLWLLPSN